MWCNLLLPVPQRAITIYPVVDRRILAPAGSHVGVFLQRISSVEGRHVSLSSLYLRGLFLLRAALIPLTRQSNDKAQGVRSEHARVISRQMLYFRTRRLHGAVIHILMASHW